VKLKIPYTGNDNNYRQQYRCDIVVPVYNSPRQVRACLESLQSCLDASIYRIIAINDCSDDFTTEYLNSLDFIEVIENSQNIGFLGSANKGLLFSNSDYVCLLNSDTVIADSGWLDKMIAYADNDSNVGLITPLSNEAVNLSLKMHSGSDINLMSEVVNTLTLSKYPDAVTVVGFCMLVRRSLIEIIGGFDETFGKGYCEESDYHYRAIKAGYSCKVADDVFLYHEGEASFAGERSSRYEKNRQEFDRRWSDQYQTDIDLFNKLEVLSYLRNDKYLSVLPLLHEEYDMLFILPAMETYGGVIVVIDIVNELIRMNIKANIVCFRKAQKNVEISKYFKPLIIPEDEIEKRIPKSKIYIATHYRTSFAVFAATHKHRAKALYLIQDDERMFENEDITLVNASYTLIPNHVYVAQWLQEKIGINAKYKKIINNGIYRDLFYPGSLPAVDKHLLHIAMMTRKDIKRGFHEGMTVINRLLVEKTSLGDRLYFHFFGNRDVLSHELNSDNYTNHGVVTRVEVANILKKSDILIDPSHFQGFGLTALEAMSSGCAVLLPDKGGASDFATHFDNAILFRSGDIEHLYEMFSLLAECASLRVKLQERAVQLPEKFCIYHSSQVYSSILDGLTQLADVPEIDSREYLKYKLQAAEAHNFDCIKKDMQLVHMKYEIESLRERLHHYMSLCNQQAENE